MKIYIYGTEKGVAMPVEAVVSTGDWIEMERGMADREDVDLSAFHVTRMMVTGEGGLRVYVVPRDVELREGGE